MYFQSVDLPFALCLSSHAVTEPAYRYIDLVYNIRIDLHYNLLFPATCFI